MMWESERFSGSPSVYKDKNIKLKQTIIEPELIARKSTKPHS